MALFVLFLAVGCQDDDAVSKTVVDELVVVYDSAGIYPTVHCRPAQIDGDRFVACGADRADPGGLYLVDAGTSDSDYITVYALNGKALSHLEAAGYKVSCGNADVTHIAASLEKGLAMSCMPGNPDLLAVLAAFKSN